MLLSLFVFACSETETTEKVIQNSLPKDSKGTSLMSPPLHSHTQRLIKYV